MKGLSYRGRHVLEHLACDQEIQFAERRGGATDIETRLGIEKGIQIGVAIREDTRYQAGIG
jgi:hypothetical protein